MENEIDPRKVTRHDFMEACRDDPVLYYVYQLWLTEHAISFEQALTAAVLILSRANTTLTNDLQNLKARALEID